LLTCILQLHLTASRRPKAGGGGILHDNWPKGPAAREGRGKSTKENTVFRGGGMPRMYLNFFESIAGKGIWYRAPQHVATTFNRAVVEDFLDAQDEVEDPTADGRMPKVIWTICLDPERKCKHVNYLGRGKGDCEGEEEFLFSAFKVESITRSENPTSSQTPHEITITACVDNKEVSCDVPTAPWA